MPDTLVSGHNLIRLIDIGKLWHEAAIFKFANDEFSIGDYVDSANTGIDFPSFGTGKLHLDKKINGDPIIK
jgi:hypothetical protein